ncbi:MAG: glutathione S-transferase family protein [Pseudomonadota bacterium]
MTTSMILHHYEASPYAEKIRLMFGHTNSSWASLTSPAWPPRPNVDPLSGGYRRIPIAQVGADIFCDSWLIAKEISAATDCKELDPASVEGDAKTLMDKAELEGFFSAITSVPPTKLLGTMLRNFGPIGAYRFVKDRSGILKGGTTKPETGDGAKAVMSEIFSTLDGMTANREWLSGDGPSIADLTVYHPIWLHLNCGGAFPKEAKNALAWFDRVAAIGEGDRKEIGQADAFAAARDNDPRPLPESMNIGDLELGATVRVAPQDYGVVPVTGSLAAATEERLILAREADDFGTVHVHFPRTGYAAGPA